MREKRFLINKTNREPDELEFQVRNLFRRFYISRTTNQTSFKAKETRDQVVSERGLRGQANESTLKNPKTL